MSEQSENWDCGEWSRCLPNNTQHRECIDLNMCDVPYKTEFRNCTYTPTTTVKATTTEQTTVSTTTSTTIIFKEVSPVTGLVTNKEETE